MAQQSSIPTDIDRMIDYAVIDRDDSSVGTVETIWQDTTGSPVFLGVRTGWFGLGKIHIVPVHTAEVNHARRVLRLPFTVDVLKNSPYFESQYEMDKAAEDRIYAYYRPYGAEPRKEMPAEAPAPVQQTAEETTIPLAEEQLKVGKREVEAGGVRLRKIVRTETVNQPVELRTEDVVIERVPGGQGQAAEDNFTEEEIFIPLRREEAVVAKETMVKEEVRLRKTAETQQQQVQETVRSEDVEIEKQDQRAQAAPTMAIREPPREATAERTWQHHPRAVFCLAADQAQAERIVDRLRAAGFSGEDISAVFPDKTGSKEFAHEKNTKAPEGATAGAGAGGLLGGTLGWLAGIGTLAIPGIGPLIAAGPIMAGLSGAAVGAAVGGMTGALVGLGIPEYEAKRYEEQLQEGRILISAHADNADEINRAQSIFEAEGATDIAAAAEEVAR